MRIVVIVLTVAFVAAAAIAGWYIMSPSSAPASSVSSSPARPVVVTPPTPAPTDLKPSVEAPKSTVRRTATPAVAPVPVEAAPTMVTLRIEADVPDATVFVDRVSVGAAPVTVPDLAPGPHRINVLATGFESYAETLEFEAGPRTVSVAFKEIKLDTAMAAVHKHGMGSCKGQLSASPQGMKYVALDGKDNFSIAMRDITAFEVDYLAKNLRVKTRQGQTYNFTDPEGNADRLFVFHRDVDKARKRVLAGQ